MKLRVITPILFLMTLLLFQACSNTQSATNTPANVQPQSSADSGKLTNEKAQRALDKWMRGEGKVIIQGIQDQGNSARADLIFQDFKYKTRDPFYGNTVNKKFSGSGYAVFTHYTDGRWILTKVQTSNGMDSIIDENVQVEAK
jgi:hypothetical protein